MSISVARAQRLMHGNVRVFKSLMGVKIENLYKLGNFKEGTQALSTQRCKDWCYSDIACDYWQFSQSDGCFVDAPMLSTLNGEQTSKPVQYPLTTDGGMSVGTAEASSMIAGEYIQHFCPPLQPPALKSDDDHKEPKNSSGLRWLWLGLVLAFLSLLACAAFVYFCFRRKMKLRGRTRAAADGDEEPLMSRVERGGGAPGVSELAETSSTQGCHPSQTQLAGWRLPEPRLSEGWRLPEPQPDEGVPRMLAPYT